MNQYLHYKFEDDRIVKDKLDIMAKEFIDKYDSSIFISFEQLKEDGLYNKSIKCIEWAFKRVEYAFNELEIMIKEGAKLVVCSTVLEELDRHKDGSNNEKKFKARKAFKLLNNHPKDVEYIVDEQPDKLIADTLFYGFDMKQPDNKILYACMNYMDHHDVEAVLVTNDNGMVAKANLLLALL